MPSSDLCQLGSLYFGGLHQLQKRIKLFYYGSNPHNNLHKTPLLLTNKKLGPRYSYNSYNSSKLHILASDSTTLKYKRERSSLLLDITQYLFATVRAKSNSILSEFYHSNKLISLTEASCNITE